LNHIKDDFKRWDSEAGKTLMNVKMHPYHSPTMCKFIMKHLLSNPPANDLKDNMKKMYVEEWR
jgi:hypothetical protein